MKTKQQIDIDQVWEQFHKTRDNLFRNLLMEHYSPLVKYTAKQLHSKLPDNLNWTTLLVPEISG